MQPTSKNEDHVPPRPFPAESHMVDRPPPSSRVFSRVVLPLVLFVVIVGVVAWVVQNMPKWQTAAVRPVAPDGPGGPGGEPVLEFTRGEKAVWDNDPDYSKDWERGTAGHFDFPFRNTLAEDVELGFAASSCDCMGVKVALLAKDEFAKIDANLARDPSGPAGYSAEPTWVELQPRERPIVVPASHQGVVRVIWNGRKDAGRPLNLTPRLWTQPKGNPAKRYDKVTLTVPILIVPVLYLSPFKAGVGVLGTGHKGEARFYIWSVTRPDLEINVVPATPDPLVDVKTRRVPPDEWPSFIAQAMEEEKAKPRLKSAFIATVTVHETKGDHQMDLGPFLRNFRVHVDELSQDASNFQVFGSIRSSVEVGGSEEQGKIKLKPFSVAQGTKQLVPLWTSGNIVLERHEHFPPGMEVNLSKLEKESSPARSKWRLEVNIPPKAIPPGTFSDESAVVLRIPNSNPPRLVRIPIIGHADAD